jgi:transcriptional regulator with XRE-family HTH domain
MDKKSLLGKRIREIRKSQGISQEQLAERAGISAQYVSNIERGKENPTLDLLLRLAEALRVSLGQMCDFETVEDMNQRKMRSSIGAILKKADPDRLRLALKLLRSLF